MNLDLFNRTADSFIMFVAFLSMLVVVAQLMVHPKKSKNIIIIFVYFCGSINLPSFSLEISGRLEDYPHLLGLSWPFHPLFAASFYLYIRLLTTPSFRVTKKTLYYAIPGVLYFLSLIPTVYLKSAEEKLAILANYYQWDLITFLNLVFFNIPGAVFATLAVYELRIIFTKERLKSIKLFRIVFVLVILAIFGLILNSVGLIIGSVLILRIDTVVYSVVMFTPFILSYRYPNLMHDISIQFSREKYRQSQVHGLNVNSVITRLNDLFSAEKIYTDPDLNIAKLSQILNITNHQLSEILNDKLKISYSNYLAKFRVDEAKTLLINNSEDTILQIAYAVGFNSKSTFNNTFKKLTSFTPTEFRKRHQKN